MYNSLPLYLVFFATIAFCIFFPDVVLWLPKQVLPQLALEHRWRLVALAKKRASLTAPSVLRNPAPCVRAL